MSTISQYTNLVFQGGGARGVAYVGVIRCLHNLGILSNFTSFAASSAGSIPAAMLALGATLPFIENELQSIDLSKIFDASSYKVKYLYDIYYNWAVCAGEELQAVIDNILKKLVGCSKITFAQAYALNGRQLIITGTSLTLQQPVYFSHLNYPNMPIATALRISCSIPFVFPPVEWGGDMWVDGGLLDNYPMRAFHINRIDSNDVYIPHTTLGVMLLNDRETRRTPAEKPTTLHQYVSAVTVCLAERTQSCYLEPEDWDRSIKVNVGWIKTTQFDMNDQQRTRLVDAGYEATAEYFSGVLPTTSNVTITYYNNSLFASYNEQPNTSCDSYIELKPRDV